MPFVGIEKLSLVDFDHHMSATLFTRSCNFKCPFCHNSSLVTNIDYKEPIIPFDDILLFLKKRKGILDAVVISGGEPTLDKDLIDEIKKIKELGYLIKLDTNGTNPEVVKYLIDNKLIDYVAMDIKNSEERYSLTCGINSLDMNKIKKSISLLINSGIDYEFRTTLVEEFHNLDNIKKMFELIKGCKRLRLQKFVSSDSCIKKGLHPVDIEEANSYLNYLKDFIDDVSLRGY